jgi:hypothetical protein
MGKRCSNPYYERIGELKSKMMNFKRLLDDGRQCLTFIYMEYCEIILITVIVIVDMLHNIY